MKIYLGILLLCAFSTIPSGGLEIISDWRLMNYNFPADFNLTYFRPENTIVTGLEVTPDRIIIAAPRLRPGVAATLSWMPRTTTPGRDVPMEAYPDWSYHGAGQENFSCSGLISVYRTRQDSCNRLWVLDAGTVNSLADFRRECTPKIMIFDLQTNNLVRSIVLSDDVLMPHSVLTNLALDETIRGKCDDAYAYISDSVAPGLIVYDAANGSAWRFSDPSFYPNPDYSSMVINNEQFTLMDGIMGLALSSQLGRLYYQAVATDRIFSVSTKALIEGPPGEFDAFPMRTTVRKSSQAMPLAINERDNSLYFCPFTGTFVASRNIRTNQQEILASDKVALQFVSDLKWYGDGYLYLMSSRFHKFFLRTVDRSDINIRVMRIPLRTARPLSPFPFHNTQYLKK